MEVLRHPSAEQDKKLSTPSCDPGKPAFSAKEISQFRRKRRNPENYVVAALLLHFNLEISFLLVREISQPLGTFVAAGAGSGVSSLARVAIGWTSKSVGGPALAKHKRSQR